MGIASLACSAPRAAAQAPTRRPNILFCISDDQTWLHTSIGGDPLVPPQIGPAPASDVDTIVHRDGTFAAFACGSSDTVNIQIKALSLISCAPITVRSTIGCASDAECPPGWECNG